MYWSVTSGQKLRYFSKLFHRHDESIRVGSRREANARGDAHVMGLRAARTSADVDERNGAALWPAACDVEKAPYVLDLRAPIDSSAPPTGGNPFRSHPRRYLHTNPI